jgi:hypothetical protein
MTLLIHHHHIKSIDDNLIHGGQLDIAVKSDRIQLPD